MVMAITMVVPANTHYYLNDVWVSLAAYYDRGSNFVFHCIFLNGCVVLHDIVPPFILVTC